MSVAEPLPALEAAAAEGLYERHSSRVFGYCLRMLGSREDAEDASQITFMQAFRALQRGVVPAFETAWLLTIARNVCLARHRASGRRKAVEIARDPQDLESVAATPEAADGELVGLLQALRRLPDNQRRAFLLREWQGRSYAEIAADLDVTVGSVEALIFRARRALARELGERKRHAFDLAWLAAAVKSALGGGAAVKIAVGTAVVVGAGTALGGSAERPASKPPAPVPAQASVPARAPAEARPERTHAAVRPDSTVAARVPVSGSAKSDASRSDRPAAESPREPGAPAPAVPAPPADAPASAPPLEATAPSAPAPGEAGAPPAVPEPPVVPPAPAVPEAPAVPALPVELPPAPVELPAAPVDQLPVKVPALPEVPALPDPPAIPDLPILP